MALCGRACLAATVVGVGVLISVPSTAWADDFRADSAESAAAPVAQGGIRESAGQGEVRESGDQGVVRDSPKAVPGITAAPQMDNPAATDWECLEAWTDHC